MSLDPEMLDILRCPESGKRLLYFPRGEDDTGESEAFLFCPESRLRYRIEDDVPVMLVEEAERVDEATAKRLVEKGGAAA